LKGEGTGILIFKAQLKAFNDVLSYGTKKGRVGPFESLLDIPQVGIYSFDQTLRFKVI
jgi:hypothetical protein